MGTRNLHRVRGSRHDAHPLASEIRSPAQQGKYRLASDFIVSAYCVSTLSAQRSCVSRTTDRSVSETNHHCGVLVRGLSGLVCRSHVARPRSLIVTDRTDQRRTLAAFGPPSTDERSVSACTRKSAGRRSASARPRSSL